jgi:hypothetical protein
VTEFWLRIPCIRCYSAFADVFWVRKDNVFADDIWVSSDVDFTEDSVCQPSLSFHL